MRRDRSQTHCTTSNSTACRSSTAIRRTRLISLHRSPKLGFPCCMSSAWMIASYRRSRTPWKLNGAYVLWGMTWNWLPFHSVRSATVTTSHCLTWLAAWRSSFATLGDPLLAYLAPRWARHARVGHVRHQGARMRSRPYRSGSLPVAMPSKSCRNFRSPPLSASFTTNANPRVLPTAGARSRPSVAHGRSAS